MAVLSADERAALADSVRSACERLMPRSRMRSVALHRDGNDEGFDSRLWQALCSQIGVAGIAVPELAGRAGLGVAAQAVIAHELGRVLAPVPFVSSAVLATDMLISAGAPVQLLKELADGEKTAAAVLSVESACTVASPGLTARRVDNGWLLDGTARHVLNGATADVVVAVAESDGEHCLFVLPASGSGVRIAAEKVLDRTRPMATFTFVDAPAEGLVSSQPVTELVDRCIQRALAVLSAEQVGSIERILEMATEYACSREQFGRPIGSFQAVKHACANMLVALEMARSASMAAVRSLDEDDGESTWLVSMAKAVCSEALRDCAHANLQIHGGIGFTSEHAAGLYVKRARTDEVLFGRTGDHWDRLAVDAGLFR